MNPVNPFTYGNPISDPNSFFGRKREVEQVFSRLSNREFESSSLVGERRIGKTSILNYLALPSVQRQQGGLDPGACIFVSLDMQMVQDATTPTELWRRLLKQLDRQYQGNAAKSLVVELRSREAIDTFSLDELFQASDTEGQRVVFLLDEFEHVTRNANFGPDFFYGMRSLVIHHKLAIVTSSRRELIDLCHSEEIRSSPFFNVFANINISMFSKEEAHQFLLDTLTPTGVRFTRREQKAIYDLAGYHPYFLQMAGHFLFEAYVRGLDSYKRRSMLSRRFQEAAEAQLSAYWRTSSDQEKILLTSLALLERRHSGTRAFQLDELTKLFRGSEQALTSLDKRGLVISDHDCYGIFSSAFTNFILSEVRSKFYEEETFGNWLVSHEGIMSRVSGRARTELREILPRIGTRYRELVIAWAGDPDKVIAVIRLLRQVLGAG